MEQQANESQPTDPQPTNRQTTNRQTGGDGAFDAPLNLLTPFGREDAEVVKLAGRPASFHGKVLGVLDNRKYNSERLMMSVAELLRRHYDLADVRLHKKPAFNTEVTQDQLAEMAQACDLVITGIGD